MQNLFEKTNELLSKLDVHNVGGNFKVRLGLAGSNPDFLFHSPNRNSLDSIAMGMVNILGRKPAIWRIENANYFQLVLTGSQVKQICDKLKINFEDVKKELQHNNAFVDNLQPIGETSIKANKR